MLVELLAAAEDYLRRQGAKEAFIYNAAGQPGDGTGPFYLGLYGSASLLGVMRSDAESLAFYQEAGYEVTGERIVLQRSLVGFRPPVDRDQVRLRKTLESKTRYDPATKNWWEAITTDCFERICSDVMPKTGGEPIASAIAWHMHPLCSSWGVRAAGFESFHASPEAWQDGTAMLLIGDAMKALLNEGATLCEFVVDALDTPAARVLTCLGFAEIDRGVTLRKTLT